VGGKDFFHRREREIGKVLVIDGVELVLFHQPNQMRKLHRDDAVRFQEKFEATDEIIDVRHMREDVVAEKQIGLLSSARQLARQSLAEERSDCRDTLLDRDLGDIPGRLNSQDRDTLGLEVLQEVTIVARHFHDRRLPAQTEALRDLVDIGPGVGEPAVGVRREVSVLLENFTGPDMLR
jgi:hypothetical protein